MILFVHIERTGGFKLHRALEPHFEGRHFVVDTAEQARAVQAQLQSHPTRDVYFGGHMSIAEIRPLLDLRQAGDLLFSTTRDPVERAVSLYFLTLRSPAMQPNLAAIAQQGGFGDFYRAARDYPVFAPNSQCRALSGTPDFGHALAAMTNDFDLVGTHRHYGAFLRRLERRLAVLIPGVSIDDSRANAAYHYETRDARWVANLTLDEVVDADTRQLIEQDNAHDMALVAHLESLPDGLWERPPAG